MALYRSSPDGSPHFSDLTSSAGGTMSGGVMSGGSMSGGAKPSGSGPVEHAVDIDSLGAVRDLVHGMATGCGLPPSAVDDLVLAANELATNVVRHGGGRGLVRLWCADDTVFCRMTDYGPGMPEPPASGEVPPPHALTGRGLWMIRRMIDRLEIDTGPHGTTVTISMSIDR
jgi:serine/threonine-protein kinase RsbW